MTAPDDTLSLDETKKRMAMAAPATKREEDVADEKAELQDVWPRFRRTDSEAVGVVRDTVWWRRLFYAVTVPLTAVVVAYPWTGGYLSKAIVEVVGLIPVFGEVSPRSLDDGLGLDVGRRGFISPVVDAASGFIPSYAAPWTKAL